MDHDGRPPSPPASSAPSHRRLEVLDDWGIHSQGEEIEFLPPAAVRLIGEGAARVLVCAAEERIREWKREGRPEGMITIYENFCPVMTEAMKFVADAMFGACSVHEARDEYGNDIFVVRADPHARKHDPNPSITELMLGQRT